MGSFVVFTVLIVNPKTANILLSLLASLASSHLVILDETAPYVYIEDVFEERGYTMTLLYEQFLGSDPGIRVELIDDTKSPYRVRTLDGFEFLVSAEDFRRFYKEAGSATPEVWRPFITDQSNGWVDANKMAELMQTLQPFEKIFQNFSRGRAFVREALAMAAQGADMGDAAVKSLAEKYTRSSIDLAELKRALDKLHQVDSDTKKLLLDESCLSFSIAVGHIGRPIMRPPGEAKAAQTLRATNQPAPSGQPVRGRGGMKNVEMKVEGDLLTVAIDLSKDFGPSKSGKTIIIASTEGNKSVPGKEHKIGLNVYKSLEATSQRGTRTSFKNVETEVDDSMLTMRIDLSKEFGPSKSGKTVIVASTEGNQLIYGRPERVGLNVYRRVDTSEP